MTTQHTPTKAATREAMRRADFNFGPQEYSAEEIEQFAQDIEREWEEERAAELEQLFGVFGCPADSPSLEDTCNVSTILG